MGQLLSVFVIGLSYGLVLFLLATGLSLTMGLMCIVNMAHGAVYMVGAFVGLHVTRKTGSFLLGLVAAGTCASLLGLLLERGFLRRLYRQEASQVLLTIGFIYILMNIAQWIWGALPESGIAPKILAQSLPVGAVELPAYRLFLVGLGGAAAIVLWFFQNKTLAGARVRAGMDNKAVAEALGINLKAVFSGVFVLGSTLAGLCGLLGSSLTGVSVSLGWEVLVQSLIVVVVGGAGSVEGSLVGGVLLGLLNAFGAVYFPRLADYVMYMALIVILLVRPSGLFGRRGQDQTQDQGGVLHGTAQMLPKRVALRLLSKEKTSQAETAKTPVSVPRTSKVVALVIGFGLAAGIPALVGGYLQDVFARILIFAIFAMSLDLLMGYTGLISFGHAAYFAAAGYAVGLLTLRADVSLFWLVFPLAVGVSALFAAAIGYLVLRVSGVYFILITMAFGQLLSVIATKWTGLTRGRDGLAGIEPPNLGFSFSWNRLWFYYLTLLVFVACYFVLRRLTKSAFGKTLLGIRENEPRMQSLGYNTWLHKYLVFVIAGSFAGVAGALYAYQYGTVVPANFGLEMSALPMLMVILGGGATLWGPCLGAAVLVLLEYLSSLYLPERWPLVMGLIFVFCVVVLKGGIAGRLSNLWLQLSAVISQRFKGLSFFENRARKVMGED